MEFISKYTGHYIDQIFNLPSMIFWILLPVLWIIFPILSVITNATIINAKWTRIYKKIHLFVLGLSALGVIGVLIFMMPWSEFRNLSIKDMIGGIMPVGMGILALLYTLGWLLVLFSDYQDMLFLKKINNTYTYKYPNDVLEYFNH